MRINVTPRSFEKLEYFKSIRFTIEYPKKFRGYLIYVREHYEGYNYRKGDIIDKRIVSEFIEKISLLNEIGYEGILFTEQDLINFKTFTKGGISKNITLNFFPETDIETYKTLAHNGNLKFYPKNFQMTFLTTNQNYVDESIFDNYVVHIPIEFIKLIETINQLG